MATARPVATSSDDTIITTTTTTTITKECSAATKESFRGRSALVTGASSGLGRSLALQLAMCGASTLILSGRNEEKLQSVAEECRRQGTGGVEVHTVLGDLSDDRDVVRLGDEAVRLGGGRIDVLVNNGGLSSRSSFLETEPAVDELLLRVNFLAGASLAKRLVPTMLTSEHGGTVLWISSVQGLLGLPNRTSYAASKFAVQGYCESLRAELHTDRVSVHVASPGYIRTNLSRSAVTGRVDAPRHGQTDEATAHGADPHDVAVEILNRTARGEPDILVASGWSARVAIWLRFLAPGLLRRIMVQRFDKTRTLPKPGGVVEEQENEDKKHN